MLTLDAFTGLLDEPEFFGLEAGVVLQAYLPESLDALVRLCAWAANGGGAAAPASRCASSRGPIWPPSGSRPPCAGWPQAPVRHQGRHRRQPQGHARVRPAARAHRRRARSAWPATTSSTWPGPHLLAEARDVATAVTLRDAPGHGPAAARAVLATTGRVSSTRRSWPRRTSTTRWPICSAASRRTPGARTSSPLLPLGRAGRLRGRAAPASPPPWRTATTLRRGRSAGRHRRPAAGHAGRRDASAAGFTNEPDTDPTDPRARVVS